MSYKAVAPTAEV